MLRINFNHTEHTLCFNFFGCPGLARMGLLGHARPDLLAQMSKTLVAMTSKERVALDRARCDIDLMLSLRSGSLALGPCLLSARILCSDIPMVGLTSQETSEKCVHTSSNSANNEL